jgi:hypothetical protein
VAQVRFHRIEGQIQIGRYLGIGEPLGQLLQDADLGGSQRVKKFALTRSGRGAFARFETRGDQCGQLLGAGIKLRLGDHVLDQLRSRVYHALGETVAFGYGESLPDQGGCLG